MKTKDHIFKMHTYILFFAMIMVVYISCSKDNEIVSFEEELIQDINDSNTDDSNTDDSNTDDSNTDDSNTDDSNTDNSNNGTGVIDNSNATNIYEFQYTIEENSIEMNDEPFTFTHGGFSTFSSSGAWSSSNPDGYNESLIMLQDRTDPNNTINLNLRLYHPYESKLEGTFEFRSNTKYILMGTTRYSTNQNGSCWLGGDDRCMLYGQGNGSGSVTIENQDDEYFTITMNITMANGTSFVGTYKGDLFNFANTQVSG